MIDLEPFRFVRIVTIAVATYWTVRGVLRTVGFARNWERRLHGWGLSRRWMRKQVAVVALRSTILDPLNLALCVTLVFLWIGPDRGWFRLDDWRGVWQLRTTADQVEGAESESTELQAPQDPR